MGLIHKKRGGDLLSMGILINENIKQQSSELKCECNGNVMEYKLFTLRESNMASREIHHQGFNGTVLIYTEGSIAMFGCWRVSLPKSVELPSTETSLKSQKSKWKNDIT